MKKILIRIALFIVVIAVLTSIIGGVVIAYANRNIDYALDEQLFENAKEDRTVYYYAYDSKGELKEVYKSAKETVREWISFDQISMNGLSILLFDLVAGKNG